METGRTEAGTSPGRIVILNGAPRAGKSSLAAKVQETIPGHWLNLGVDHANRALPPELWPGIGLRPGGERPDLEPIVFRLYRALFITIVTHASAGFDIVADLGLHDDYSTPLGIYALATETLGPHGALLVGIDCDIAEIMRRRNADPRGGLYLGGDDVPPPVARWQHAVHAGKTYDLRLDMGKLSPEQGAEEIARLLDDPPRPSALKPHPDHIS
jgi:chloramphenicol 3-O phosphotransferase